MERSSCGSEVVVIDDRIMQTVEGCQPSIANLNVNKSSRVHIGPKFVTVTQNVDKTEVVKDLPFYRYMWDVTKSTTKAERVSCATAMFVLIICILLIVYFTVIAKDKEKKIADVAPHEWFITREMWLATKNEADTKRTDAYNPLKLVIVAHTVSSECSVFINCAAEMRNIQRYSLKDLKYDIAYNFVIGNDGRVYEGRGWNIVGAHTIGYNSCSMGLAFVGDYREGLPSYSKVTDLQQQRAQMLFQEGIRLGYLHPKFQVLGAKDLKSTLSPGTNLYRAIRKWSNYDHDHLFTSRTCDQIEELFKHEDANTTTIPTTDVTFT
ncbi:unnamed protein product [Arctia plantaginis]|uniref:Peptidoglycan recognition protein n=1 Tax=Arctia plantaginis TaxID=874455 RepID=A0A8S0Z1I4_ARCPL|nr:unnamed protein product [Arctia plantaginis]